MTEIEGLRRRPPSIVLIGGPMTVDDGSRLDSRQPLLGDPQSRVARRSLAASMLWWDTASSVVLPLLEEEGADAFALAIGARSIVDLRSDGQPKRTGLRKMLHGGVGVLSIVRTSMDEPLPDGYEVVEVLKAWNDQSLGTVGVKDSGAGSRWRFLDGNDYYLRFARKQVGASVIVDTSDAIGIAEGGAATSSEHFETFEQSRLPFDGSVLVVPHTDASERFLRTYGAWVEAGRPAQSLAWTPEGLPARDPTVPPDPLRYAHPVPIEAQFRVTGLLQGADWRDPAELEAARALLHARYDLKLGLWDLADNPVLRTTLLEAAPVVTAPSSLAQLPEGAAERAANAVTRKLERDARTAKGLQNVDEQLRELRDNGWESVERMGPAQLRFPLTEPQKRWPTDEDALPLVQLMWTVTKQETRVAASTTMYKNVDIRAYVENRRSELEEVAGAALGVFDRSWPVLWREPSGWGDEVDWASRARDIVIRTSRWKGVFEDLASECVRIAAERSIERAPDINAWSGRE